MPTTIYVPTSIPHQESLELAPSPSTLAGLRIAVLDNGKANAGVVMERAVSALAAATGATVSLVTKKGPGGRSANAAIPCAPDIVERLLAESDLVVTGAADCGSCTAYSVHDAIELERAGRPAVVVTTTRFRPIAETLAANFGLPDARLLVLPHPIGGTERAALHRWADASVGALTELFRATTSAAVVDTGEAVGAQAVAEHEPDSAADRDQPAGVARPPSPDATGRREPSAGDEAPASAATLAAALHELRATVQADGGDLRLAAFDADTGTATVDLLLEDASCADCVMPAEHLEALILPALQAAMPAVQRVTVNDPRP